MNAIASTEPPISSIFSIRAQARRSMSAVSAST
jgi:hypothetical protein